MTRELREPMDIDGIGRNKGRPEELKENGLNLYPVSADDSGEGPPYAPEDWPNPGDKWVWKVGKRVCGNGYFSDRFLYLPRRLRRPGNSGFFRSKRSLNQYIQSTFPDADVVAFFASFSWKIPSMSLKKGSYIDNAEGTVREKISEVEFGNKNTCDMSKIGPSTRTKQCEDNGCGLVSPNVAFHDKSSSFIQKGEDNEHMDLEAYYLERIDEVEFRSNGAHFVSENRASSAYSRRKKIDEELVSGDGEIPGVEMNLGVASRTRSKTAIIKKHPENEEGTSHETNSVPEENVVINTIPGDNETTEPRSNTIEENLQKSQFSKEGGNVLQCKNQKGAGIKRRRKAVSSTHSKDRDCGNSDDEHVRGRIDAPSSDIQVTEVDESEKQNTWNRGSSKYSDLWTKLANSVLGRGPLLENDESNVFAKQTPPNQYSLPLKFRFEDDVPPHVEKTDYEKEIDGLWDLFNHDEVELECESNPVGETQGDPCPEGPGGEHEYVTRDDTGVTCRYCLHVAVDPKDIIPEWAEKSHRKPNRKRSSSIEDLAQLDELCPESSTNRSDVVNRDDGTVWDIKPETGFRESMYKHQQEGFEFLWTNLAGSINLADLKSSNLTEVGGCIISHAPGTGKTRLTIVFIESYMRLFRNCLPVIIAPASMLLTWEEEFKKWNVGFPFHNLNNLEFLDKENNTSLGRLAGSKRRNKDLTRMMKIYSWNMGGSILGISYSLFGKLTGEKYMKEQKNNRRSMVIDEQIKDLRKILLEKPGLVVLDEGHTPRNKRSNIWNALHKLHTGKRVILSGTPFQNNFVELFNTLRLVRPAIADELIQEKTFSGMISSRGLPSRRKSDAKDSRYASSSKAMNSAVEKLKAAMCPFVHVHKGTILQESLPGLRDSIILLKPSALQKSLIDTLEGSQSTFKFEHRVALISVHPYLSKYCESTRLGIELESCKLNPNDGVKTKFILELVRLSVIKKEKVLVFSQYIQPLELIKEQLRDIFEWTAGKQILQMEGKIDQKQRQILINTFNDPYSEAKVMLASTRCCSEGISLVGASRVVLLDVVWNPSVEHQAISRAYRIGQKKFVHTYHLMTSGTPEADKYCRQVEKERLSELVFCSSSNESKERRTASFEDTVLEEMVSHEKLKDMFEKIINQPKDTDLIQTFGLT